MRDPQVLAKCLVEGDPARVGRFRSLRRRALLFSVVGEGILLAALLLAPLVSPGTLARRMDWTPIPPYGGTSRSAHDASPAHRSPASHRRTPNVIIFRPPVIPAGIDRSGDHASDPDEGAPIGEGNGDNPAGLIQVPFDIDRGIRIQPPQPPLRIPAQAPTKIHVSEGAQQALLEHRVIPLYPVIALQTRTSGEVKLHAIIGTDGAIRFLEVESGNALLVGAALDAVRQWRYRPALLNGQPVEVDTFITVIFHLGQ